LLRPNLGHSLRWSPTGKVKLLQGILERLDGWKIDRFRGAANGSLGRALSGVE